MKFRNAADEPQSGQAAARGFLPQRRLAVLIGVLGSGALTGCGLSGDAGDLMVDPGHYAAYHCNDLATRGKELAKREKDLRELMARADEGNGGALIGMLTYRADYDSVLTEEKIVQRETVEKKCEVPPPPSYTSDQTIR
jgi:hypothetical protein